MIVVELANVRASIEGQAWSSDDAGLRELLQSLTDAIAIHGGMPEPDEFIVATLADQLPLRVVDRRDPPEDPEATEPAPDEGEIVVY